MFLQHRNQSKHKRDAGKKQRSQGSENHSQKDDTDTNCQAQKQLRRDAMKIRPKAREKAMVNSKHLTRARGKVRAPGPPKDQDYEHAGVAIAMHKKRQKNPEEVREVSGRLIVAKLKGAGGAITFLSVYVPTADSRFKKRHVLRRFSSNNSK